MLGRRTLLVDLDPQAHATIALGLNPDDLDLTVGNVLTQQHAWADILKTPRELQQLDFAPSCARLRDAEVEIQSLLGKEMILSELLRAVQGPYELCVIDAPAGWGLLTENALVASTDLIVPVQTHYLGLKGIHYFLERVHDLRQRFHSCLPKILGLLLTYYDERTSLSRQIAAHVRDQFNGLVFETVIHTANALAKAAAQGESVLSSIPESRCAIEYGDLAQECLARLEGDSEPEFGRSHIG